MRACLMISPRGSIDAFAETAREGRPRDRAFLSPGNRTHVQLFKAREEARHRLIIDTMALVRHHVEDVVGIVS